jgi:glyoxylate/hydroxypyruvate reductase A
MSIVFLSGLDSPERSEWHSELEEALPEETLLLDATEELGDDVDIAIVANPPKGKLTRFPQLRLIQSAWAGVDALLTDPELPDVPIARLVDPSLASHMAEAALTHSLAIHRQAPAYERQQRSGTWRQLRQPRASQRRVGVLGLGEMGRAAAALLHEVGFDVAGWSRTDRSAQAPYATFHGPEGFSSLIRRCDILINLLPLTPETAGIIDRDALVQLPEGASIINLGRGGHLVAQDLIDALDTGRIRHAVLDVFETEPLPPGDPLWSRDDVTITPHVAAETDPATASREIAANIRRFRSGEPLVGQVQRSRGY